MERLLSLARINRKHMPPCERKLWYEYLSKYPIRFMRQKVIGDYIIDFYCKQAKLAIELNRLQHYSDKGRENDEGRKKKIEEQGILVIAYSNVEIKKNFKGVCEDIDRMVKNRMGKE